MALQRPIEQERLSVWYEVSDEEHLTEDDEASLLPPPPVRQSILIGGSGANSGRPSSRAAVSAGRYQRVDGSKGEVSCIDVTMFILSSLAMGIYGVAAYYAMHWHILYGSGVYSCNVDFDLFLLVCAIHAAIMAALLLAYSSRALLAICRYESVPPFMESPSCTYRATEAFIIMGAIAQVCLGVWGEAWASPIGLLTAVYHPGSCSLTSSTADSLFTTSWVAAAFEFAMLVLVLILTLLWACAASRTDTDNDSWLTVSSRGAADAGSGRGGNRALNEQLTRTSTPPILSSSGGGAGASAATTTNSGNVVTPNGAFNGPSHTIAGKSPGTRRDRPSRSCS